MTVRYQVLVDRDWLAEAHRWDMPDGFRLVSNDGPEPGHRYVNRCTFEDDTAPDELAGHLVEVVFRRINATGPGQVQIAERHLVR